jgi:serine/threonine-protein kinase
VITPDGSHVVYLGNNGTRLFSRTLDSLEPVVIATGQLRNPFVSPDGNWIGFVDFNTTLKKVAITGGPPVALARLDGNPRGATWLPDGTIIFATNNPTTGLQRISAAGGPADVLTTPDPAKNEDDHLWPEIAADGRTVLFTITARTGGLGSARIAKFDIQTHRSTVLVSGGSHAQHVGGAFLVYVADGGLRAVRFDATRAEILGPTVPILSRLITTDNGAAEFAVASNGTLVYGDAPGNYVAGGRALVWVDRTGQELPLPSPQRRYLQPRLSEDGSRVAVFIVDQEQDVWVWDLMRITLTRITTDPARDGSPVWTVDGHRIVFASAREGGIPNVWWQAADGSGAAERLIGSSNSQAPQGFSPDGRHLIVEETTPQGADLLDLALDGIRRTSSIVRTRFAERNGAFSPDGHWLAYESNSSGTFENLRPAVSKRDIRAPPGIDDGGDATGVGA